MKWGIVGAANIAEKSLIPAIRKAGSTVQAVAARDVEKARTFAAKQQIPHHCNYEELVARDDLDAIYVPLPNSEHLEWSVKALEHGKHVLCEKPLTLNAAETRQMIEAQQKSGKLVLEAFSYRFHPHIDRMLQRIREGAIGEVRVIHSAFSFQLDRPNDIRWDPKLGGGAFYDVGCYSVDLIRLVAAEQPAKVHVASQFTERGVDHTLGGLLEFSSCHAHFDCSFCLPFEQLFRVIGTGGSLQIDAPFTCEDYESTLTVNGEAEKFPKVDVYEEMVRHFEKAIRGEVPLKYPLETHSLPQMQILDQVLAKTPYPSV